MPPVEGDEDRRWGVDGPERLAPVEAEPEGSGVELDQVDVTAEEEVEQAGGVVEDGEGEPGLGRRASPSPASEPVLLESLASSLPAIEAKLVPPSPSTLLPASIMLSVLSGVAVLSTTLVGSRSKLPSGMRQSVAVHSGRLLMKSTTPAMVSTKSSFGPSATVLNALAIDTMVTSSPPARWLRSESTGIGA